MSIKTIRVTIGILIIIQLIFFISRIAIGSQFVVSVLFHTLFFISEAFLVIIFFKCNCILKTLQKNYNDKNMDLKSMIDYITELELKIKNTSQKSESSDDELRKASILAEEKITKIKNELQYYKTELVQYLNPIKKIFYYKENNFTVSERINSIISQLITNIKSTVNDMNHQSETLTLTFEAFDITTLTMEKVDSIIQSASKLASDLSNRTEEGQSAVVLTKQGMQNIMNFSEKMASIITTIVDISDKTNILAINAAIESTRAGKMGKGFAVISGEIRSLANTTREASIEIKNIIEVIIKRIRKQAEQINQVHETFIGISNYISKTTELNKEIYKISRKSIIQGKEIQTAVNMLKEIAEKIISSSSKELFEANEIMTIMKAIEKLFTKDNNFNKFFSAISNN